MDWEVRIKRGLLRHLLRSVSPRAVVLFLDILSYSDKNNSSFPSITTLARNQNVSRSTLIRILKELEDAGLLRKEKRRGRTSVYELVLSTSTVTRTEDSFKSSSGCRHLPARGSIKNDTGVVADLQQGSIKNDTGVVANLQHRRNTNEGIPHKDSAGGVLLQEERHSSKSHSDAIGIENYIDEFQKCIDRRCNDLIARKAQNERERWRRETEDAFLSLLKKKVSHKEIKMVLSFLSHKSCKFAPVRGRQLLKLWDNLVFAASKFISEVETASKMKFEKRQKFIEWFKTATVSERLRLPAFRTAPQTLISLITELDTRLLKALQSCKRTSIKTMLHLNIYERLWSDTLLSEIKRKLKENTFNEDIMSSRIKEIFEEANRTLLQKKAFYEDLLTQQTSACTQQASACTQTKT